MQTRFSHQLSDRSNLQLWTQYLTLLLMSLFAATAAAGGQSFFDYARVLNVDPISETVALPVKKERCFYPTSAIRADERLAGEVRSGRPGIKIGAAIVEEIQHRKNRASIRRCRLVTTYRNRDRVIAYRVRYEYGGDTFVRRMQKHPGERVLVRVNLHPL